MKKVYVLKTDAVEMNQPVTQPFGVAVETQGEAERYVEEGGVGSRHRYEEFVVFPNKDEAVAYANETLGMFPNGTGAEFTFKHFQVAENLPAGGSDQPQSREGEEVEYYELQKLPVYEPSASNDKKLKGFFYHYNGEPLFGQLAEILTELAGIGWRPVFIKADEAVVIERIVQKPVSENQQE